MEGQRCSAQVFMMRLQEITLAAASEVQPHHLSQMQDKHKTTAAMGKKINLEIIKQQGSHP